MLTEFQYNEALASILVPASLISTTNVASLELTAWGKGFDRDLSHDYWHILTANSNKHRNSGRSASFTDALDWIEGRWRGITPLHDALSMRIFCIECLKGNATTKPVSAAWTVKLLGYLEWLIRWRNSLGIDYFADLKPDHYRQFHADANTTDISRLVPLVERLDILIEQPRFQLPLTPYGARQRVDWNRFSAILGVTRWSTGHSKSFCEAFAERAPILLRKAGLNPDQVVLFVGSEKRRREDQESRSKYNLLPWQLLERLSIKGLINHDPLTFKPSRIMLRQRPDDGKKRTDILLPRDLLRLLQLCAQWILEFAPYIVLCLNERKLINPSGKVHLNVSLVGELMGRMDELRPRDMPPLGLFLRSRFAARDDRLPLADALKYVFVAAAILAGSFGARRREEIASLQEGAIFTRDGLIYMTVYIEKTLQDIDAVPIPEIVEKAIKCVASLSETARHANGTPWLFQFTADMADGTLLQVETDFANHLIDFVTFCGLPPPEGDVIWKLNFHMLRKGFVVSFYHGSLVGSFDATNWTLRHSNADQTRIYMDDGDVGAISYLRSEVARLSKVELEQLSDAERKYLFDAKDALAKNKSRRKIWNTARMEFFVSKMMEIYDGEERPIGGGAARLLDLLREMEEKAFARTRILTVPTNGPPDVRNEVIRQVKTLAASQFLEPVPGTPLYCNFRKGRADHATLAVCVSLAKRERVPWRSRGEESNDQWPNYNFSGLFPCLGCGLCVAFDRNQKQIEHIIEDREAAIQKAGTAALALSARQYVDDLIGLVVGAKEAVRGKQRS